MHRNLLPTLAVIAAIAAVASVLWLAAGRAGKTVQSDVAQLKAGDETREPASVEAPRSRPGAFPEPAPPAPDPEVDVGEMPSGMDDDEIAAAWSTVDLEEVRKAMPDNLYWQLSVPTKDPGVLEERDAERARWNVEYGKILSGTASEEEIRAYYDHRARLSGDYIEFATHLLDHYRETLPERDIGLLKLARRLHGARLEEIPRKIEEAFERKRAQDAAREAWLADQAIFGAAQSDDPTGPGSEPE